MNYEEVAYQRYVHPHADVQQPAAYEVESRSAYRQHQLPQQHEPYKANVPVLYTHVYYRLRQERQHELQQATQCKPHGYLPEVLSVFLQVAEQEAERTAFAAVA